MKIRNINIVFLFLFLTSCAIVPKCKLEVLNPPQVNIVNHLMEKSIKNIKKDVILKHTISLNDFIVISDQPVNKGKVKRDFIDTYAHYIGELESTKDSTAVINIVINQQKLTEAEMMLRKIPEVPKKKEKKKLRLKNYQLIDYTTSVPLPSPFPLQPRPRIEPRLPKIPQLNPVKQEYWQTEFLIFIFQQDNDDLLFYSNFIDVSVCVSRTSK